MLRPQTRSQLLLQNCDVGGGAIVGTPRTFARDIRGRDNVNLVMKMIERQQPVEEHQHAIRQGKIVFRVCSDILQLPHRVVAKVAHRTRGEGRQSWHDGWTMLPQQLFYDLNRVSAALFLPLAMLDYDISILSPHLHVGTCPQESVSADLFATLHRLQQKGVGLMGRDREKGGNRGQ